MKLPIVMRWPGAAGGASSRLHSSSGVVMRFVLTQVSDSAVSLDDALAALPGIALVHRGQGRALVDGPPESELALLAGLRGWDVAKETVVKQPRPVLRRVRRRTTGE